MLESFLTTKKYQNGAEGGASPDLQGGVRLVGIPTVPGCGGGWWEGRAEALAEGKVNASAPAPQEDKQGPTRTLPRPGFWKRSRNGTLILLFSLSQKPRSLPSRIFSGKASPPNDHLE